MVWADRFFMEFGDRAQACLDLVEAFAPKLEDVCSILIKGGVKLSKEQVESVRYLLKSSLLDCAGSLYSAVHTSWRPYGHSWAAVKKALTGSQRDLGCLSILVTTGMRLRCSRH